MQLNKHEQSLVCFLSLTEAPPNSAPDTSDKHLLKKKKKNKATHCSWPVWQSTEHLGLIVRFTGFPPPLSSLLAESLDPKCGTFERSRMPIAPHTLKIAGTVWIVFLDKDACATGTFWVVLLARPSPNSAAKEKIPAPRLRNSKTAHLTWFTACFAVLEQPTRLSSPCMYTQSINASAFASPRASGHPLGQYRFVSRHVELFNGNRKTTYPKKTKIMLRWRNAPGLESKVYRTTCLRFS